MESTRMDRILFMVCFRSQCWMFPNRWTNWKRKQNLSGCPTQRKAFETGCLLKRHTVVQIKIWAIQARPSVWLLWIGIDTETGSTGNTFNGEQQYGWCSKVALRTVYLSALEPVVARPGYSIPWPSPCVLYHPGRFCTVKWNCVNLWSHTWV